LFRPQVLDRSGGQSLGQSVGLVGDLLLDLLVDHFRKNKIPCNILDLMGELLIGIFDLN
jgi:hypothetical protein